MESYNYINQSDISWIHITANVLHQIYIPPFQKNAYILLRNLLGKQEFKNCFEKSLHFFYFKRYKFTKNKSMFSFIGKREEVCLLKKLFKWSILPLIGGEEFILFPWRKKTNMLLTAVKQSHTKMTFAIKKRKYLRKACEYFAMAKWLLAFRKFPF